MLVCVSCPVISQLSSTDVSCCDVTAQTARRDAATAGLAKGAGWASHRGVLALDAGGVEADGRDALNLALDVEHALVVLLARLRLGEVASSQRDGTDHPGGDQDVRRGEDLRTALR